MDGQLNIFDYLSHVEKELGFKEIKKMEGRIVLVRNQKGEKREIKIARIIPPDEEYSIERILYIDGRTAVCIGENDVGKTIHFFESRR
jgi:hypothetical protein